MNFGLNKKHDALTGCKIHFAFSIALLVSWQNTILHGSLYVIKKESFKQISSFVPMRKKR